MFQQTSRVFGEGAGVLKQQSTLHLFEKRPLKPATLWLICWSNSAEKLHQRSRWARNLSRPTSWTLKRTEWSPSVEYFILNGWHKNSGALLPMQRCPFPLSVMIGLTVVRQETSLVPSRFPPAAVRKVCTIPASTSKSSTCIYIYYVYKYKYIYIYSISTLLTRKKH